MRLKPRRFGLGRERFDDGAGALLIRRPAPVEGDDRSLVLDPNPPPAQVGGVGLSPELVDPPRPVLDAWIEHRFRPARAKQLRSMGPQVGDRPDRHHGTRLGGAAAADARHDLVSPGDLDQQDSGLLGHPRLCCVLHNRSERPVDVEQDRGARGVLPHRRERFGKER